jgi:hypothetical protein
MSKGKMNITMDQDLIEYAKIYANEQCTMVSEVFSQISRRRISCACIRSCSAWAPVSLLSFVI